MRHLILAIPAAARGGWFESVCSATGVGRIRLARTGLRSRVSADSA